MSVTTLISAITGDNPGYAYNYSGTSGQLFSTWRKRVYRDMHNMTCEERHRQSPAVTLNAILAVAIFYKSNIW